MTVQIEHVSQQLHGDERPRRVTDAIAERAADLRADLDDGAWIYVSGHQATSAPVRAAFESIAGEDTTAQMYRDLRYIDST